MRRAFLDANVLFSAALRDVLLWLAFRDVCQVRFSALVHEEWMRAVLKQRPHTKLESLENTRDLMNKNISGGLVEGFEPLIESLSLPDSNDRHVLAAARHSKCDTLVTWNRSDFPAASAHPIRVQTPDEFLLELFEANRKDVLASLRAQRQNLRKPPVEVADFLVNLRTQNLTRFASALEPFQNQL